MWITERFCQLLRLTSVLHGCMQCVNIVEIGCVRTTHSLPLLWSTHGLEPGHEAVGVHIHYRCLMDVYTYSSALGTVYVNMNIVDSGLCVNINVAADYRLCNMMAYGS